MEFVPSVVVCRDRTQSFPDSPRDLVEPVNRARSFLFVAYDPSPWNRTRSPSKWTLLAHFIIILCVLNVLKTKNFDDTTKPGQTTVCPRQNHMNVKTLPDLGNYGSTFTPSRIPDLAPLSLCAFEFL